ncbi:MAG TPA: threonine/serine exporter family protein [Candidatus Kapabacteria bacterium]|nr:threonine/serine exporter family protein [Candidatus Kapabacteria bacterium]
MPALANDTITTETQIAFALKLARMLHRYGTPTHRLEDAMAQVLGRLGIEGIVFSIPTGIFAGFGPAEAQRTAVIRADLGQIHLEKLAMLEALVRHVTSGEIDVEEADRQLDAIAARPARYGAPLRFVCFAVASATAARSFGGGWREVLVAAVIGVITGGLMALAGRAENARRISETLAAIIAGALVVTVSRVVFPASTYIPMIAGLIVLVPGLMLTTAVTELATRNLVSGTARLTGAVMVFLELGIGAALGGQIGRLLPDAPHVQRTASLLPEWTLYPALLLAPAAFAVLFRTAPRDIVWVMVTGIAGFAGARLGSLLLGPALGTFVGAVLIGLLGNFLARALKRPSTLLLVPGIVFLFPGSFGFGSFSKFIENDILSGITIAFELVLATVALVTGLLLANAILPPRRAL